MSGSSESPLPSSKRIKSEPPEEATTTSVLPGSPESGKSALVENESLEVEPDQPHGCLADVPVGLQLLYESMRTWYEQYVDSIKKRPRKPGKPRPFPPAYMMLFPRLFEKTWGFDRLFPRDIDVWSIYHAYLKNFHKHNAELYSDPEAYHQMENRLRSEWLTRGTKIPQDEIIHSDNILKCALQLMFSESGGSSLAMNAARCIAKETELIIEKLRHGSSVLDREELPNQSTEIRQLALRYMEGCQCGSDVALLALNVSLLGITKEAELLVQNLRKGYYNFYQVYQSRRIRCFAVEIITQKLDVFTTYANMAADDFKANLVTIVEEDAEKHCWRYLVEYNLTCEEASGIENSEKKQVHHMLLQGDDEKKPELNDAMK